MGAEEKEINWVQDGYKVVERGRVELELREEHRAVTRRQAEATGSRGKGRAARNGGLRWQGDVPRVLGYHG